MTNWFDSYGNFIGVVPEYIVGNCTHPGRDAWTYVKDAIEDLGFTLGTHEDRARKYLIDLGIDEVEQMDLDTVTAYVFWVICGDIRENGESFGIAE